MKLAFGLVALAIATAAADPVALEPYKTDTGSVSMPKGWKITAQKDALVAQQDPKRADAAMLLLVVSGSGVTATEDQLLDAVTAKISKDVKVTARGALPGGHGRTLIAEGTANKMAVRLGAVAVANNGAAVVCLLAAKTDEFDALGGVGLPRDVIASIKTPATPPAAKVLDDVSRGHKRAGQPDLPADRAALTNDQVARTWSRVSATSMQITDDVTPTQVRSHHESTEEGEMFAFHKDGTYTLTSMYKSNHKTCNSSFFTTELGTYTFDGKALVMTTKEASTKVSLCGATPKVEAIKKLPGPRAYDVGLTSDGYLVMFGPSCSATAGNKCIDHARWEMKPQ